MFHSNAARRSFVTNDGAEISYLEAGSGRPFIMIPGWSQTAAQWHHQIDHFAATHRVIAMDMRGHGESAKVEHGYRIHRLARDVRELMEQQDIDDAVIMGHSMGCSVIWALLDLYGSDRLSRIVLVDEPAYLLQSDYLSPDEQVDAGAIFPHEAAVGLAQGLSDASSYEATLGSLLDVMVTSDIDPAMKSAMAQANAKLPGRLSARLLMNHVYMDWRDVIARIDVPTLCVGGDVSNVPANCMPWAASVIDGAQVEVFSADDKGSHFMFMENPDRFNARLDAFLE